MGEDLYFGEREQGTDPCDSEEISNAYWGGFVELTNSRIDDGSFAEAFPENCHDSPIPAGTARGRLFAVFGADFPALGPGLDPAGKPATHTALEIAEFFHRYVSKVVQQSVHDYWRHSHYERFDRDLGRFEYRADINRMLRRNHHPFSLGEDGMVRRLRPEVLRDLLATELRTGENELDRLLSDSVRKFSDADFRVRLDALEKLWDAWERLKTIEDADKKRGWAKLRDRSVLSVPLRLEIESEATALTAVGNRFLIRHSEVGKVPIERPIDLDYLFHRLFSLIRLLVRGRQS